MASNNVFSRGETQFIFQAVGDVLIEIQSYISTQGTQLIDRCRVCSKIRADNSLSGQEKRPNFKSAKPPSHAGLCDSVDDLKPTKLTINNDSGLDRTRSNSKTLSDINDGCHCSGLQRPKSYDRRLPFTVESLLTFGKYNRTFRPSAEIVILSLIYIDRFMKSQFSADLGRLGQFNIAELFLVSTIISIKFNEEYYVKNAYFMKSAAKNCCIYRIAELNQLESMFLEAIDYKLTVLPGEADQFFEAIQKRANDLQQKQFEISQTKFELIEDYFETKRAVKKTANDSMTHTKVPPVYLAGKLFKDREEVYHFFHCDNICDDTSTLSDDESVCSLSD